MPCSLKGTPIVGSYLSENENHIKEVKCYLENEIHQAQIKTNYCSFHFHYLFIYLQNIPSLDSKNSELLAILWENK